MARLSILLAGLAVAASAAVLLAGCAPQASSPTPGGAASPATAAPAGAAPKAATGAPSAATPAGTPAGASATSQPSPTGAPVAAPAAAAPPPPSKPLFLQVDAPAGDTSVDSATLSVTGHTIPDAVVSVNGDLVDVNADGSFSAQIHLDEGPNDLEVVASDTLGNEQSVIRSVIYAP